MTLRGGAIPTRVTAANAVRYAPELVTRPAWLRDFMRDGLRLDLPNVRTERDGTPLTAAEASKSMRATAPRWEDFAWLREQWSGPIIAKGLLRPDDARRAIDAGADAIVVSNHGGNALDSTPPTIRSTRCPGIDQFLYWTRIGFSASNGRPRRCSSMQYALS